MAIGQDTLVGKVLGHYRVLEKVGAGGMGEVYRARDEHLDREVAIKVLPPGTLADESARKRFRKEAIALSRLNHPNIATIHDFDTQDGVDFLVMEYIPGTTLSDKIAGKPLTEKEVINLGAQLADGLAAAHEHGVTHRDLKPGNLRLMSDGRLKILDFGLAKLQLPTSPTATTAQSFGETQGIAGTLPYMAPEQLLGGEVDARTDIHAAGAALYKMATGQRPFAETERSQLIGAILRSSPVPPGSLNRSLSPDLERIIEKCLEREPEDRYQSARELAVDLRQLARDRLPGRATVEVQPAPRPSIFMRYKVLLATAALAVVLLLSARFWLVPTKKLTGSAAIPPSIAVLPFLDLSPKQDQEYFAEGLAEELLNSLAQIPGLHVAARTSAFQFKGKNEDLRVIGQKLNVATVLEGSVRKQGQRVRISAQLIQVSDGFHLWSAAYDRDLTDIFAVQEDIAKAVAAALRVRLLGEKAPPPRSTSIDAYNAYLRGRYFCARGPLELEKAIAYYEDAIKLDPNYAAAWAELSLAHAWHAEALHGGQGAEEFKRAREAAERALGLDPSLADAHAADGAVRLYYDWDWVGAEASFQQALSLQPANVWAIWQAAELAGVLNHFDEALRLDRQAVELDPLHAFAFQTLAFHAWWAGRLDEAEAAIHRATELEPDYPWLHMTVCSIYLARSQPQEALAEAERENLPAFRLQGLAMAYNALGRKQDSDRVLAELVEKFQGIFAFQIAEVYAFQGETNQAFAWLDRAYEQREPGLVFVKGDPNLKNLEHDLRYAAFLKKMHLAD